MITSEANAQVKEIIRLQKNAKERRKQKLFVAEGVKLAKEAAFYGKLQKVYVSEAMWKREALAKTAVMRWLQTGFLLLCRKR